MSEKPTKADLLAELQGLRAEKDRLQSELHRVMDLDGASLPVSELRGQLQLLHAMMNSSLDCVLTIDSHGVVREFNEAAEKTFGYSREYAVGKQMSELIVPPNLREAHESGMERYLKTGHGPVLNNRIEITAMRADGSEFPVELAIVPVRVEEEEMFVGWVRDLTDRHRAEEALQRSEAQLREAHKMEAVGKLAGGIAHDFNNLLTVVIGYAEMLPNMLDNPDRARQMSAEILGSANTAATLTRQLLAVGRRQMFKLEVLNLTELVRMTTTMLSSSLRDHIVVATSVSDTPIYVEADAQSVRQMLLNLALNAQDAMPQGGTLRISLTRCEKGDSPEARLVVSDSGCGMPPEVMERAFEPFYTTKPMGEGSGLGLSTVYGTVQQLEGSVDIFSEEGEGTVVTMVLPLVQAPAPKKDPGPRVLLVEDQESVRAMLRMLLESEGCHVELAEDGYAAKGRLEEGEPPDLLVTDVEMPNLGGVDLVEWYWHGHPGSPVLLISGNSDSAAIQSLVDTGPARFLSKPFKPVELVEAFRSLLDAPRSKA